MERMDANSVSFSRKGVRWASRDGTASEQMKRGESSQQVHTNARGRLCVVCAAYLWHARQQEND